MEIKSKEEYDEIEAEAYTLAEQDPDPSSAEGEILTRYIAALETYRRQRPTLAGARYRGASAR